MHVVTQVKATQIALSEAEQHIADLIADADAERAGRRQSKQLSMQQQDVLKGEIDKERAERKNSRVAHMDENELTRERLQFAHIHQYLQIFIKIHKSTCSRRKLFFRYL